MAVDLKDMPEFSGFPEQGMRFLRQLKKNNDRDWFRERKDDYVKYVDAPMTELVLAVAAGCRKRGLEIYAKEKNPVMRVYRDIRFSPDKKPFKTHVGAELRKSFTDSECLLYLHVSPEDSFMAAGIWQPERGLLQAWRAAMLSEPARFQKMLSGLRRGRLELSKEQALSGMPRGMQSYSDQPIGPWLKLTSFVVSRPLTQEDCARPNLVKAVIDFAVHAKPLFEFAWEVENSLAQSNGSRLQERALL